MIMMTYLVIINLLAAVGIVAIVYMIDEIKADRNLKKKKNCVKNKF